jgi:hypothetical protein
MKTKLLMLVVTLCYSISTCLSQNFYEVKWKGNDSVSYIGLLIYNSENDALMRVNFTSNGVYRVAEYKCTCKYFTTYDGQNCYLINGMNANVVYNQDGKTTKYFADNFLFSGMDAQHRFKNLYAYDENDLQKSNLAELMRPAQWKKLDPAIDFNEPYIHSFYGTYEHNYTALLSFVGKKTDYATKKDGDTKKDDDTKTDYGTGSTKLYLIVVANTLDNSIGNGCDVDRKKLVNEMNDISGALNIPIEEHVIYGTDFNRQNVLNAISAIAPSRDDIVMFFYRGHGFRWDNQQSAWPDMSMRYSNYQPFESISLDEVYNLITAKGARLNVIFGDLCNTSIGINQVTNAGTNSLQSNFYPDIDKLKKLFLYSKGTLMSVAAKPGEVSWTSAYDGGFFTSSFFEALHAEIGKFSGTGSWKNILTATIDKALYKSQYTCSTCSVQHGEYYVSPELANQ